MKYVKKQSGFAWAAIIAVFFIVIGFFTNTMVLNGKMEALVKQYIVNDNEQLANHISVQLESGQEFVTNFAEFLSRMPEIPLTEEMLERKAKAMEQDHLVVVTKTADNRLEILGDGSELTQWIEKNPEVWEKPMVSFLETKSILFSAPVWKNGQAERIVIGAQSYRELHSLVKKSDNWKTGIRILLDPEKEEILMLEQGVKSIIQRQEIPELLEELKKADYQRNIKIGKKFACAQPVEQTEWIQISLIHLDTLMRRMSGYIQIYLGLILAELVILAASIYFLKRNAKKREQVFLKDPLTGGYNRAGFLKLGNSYMNKNNRKNYAIVCLNVCNFRYMNELWGEETGNRTLQFIHSVVSGKLRQGELVCRSNMDHFMLLLKENSDRCIAERIADMIGTMNDTISKKFGCYTLNFTIGCCRLDTSKEMSLALSNASYAEKQNTRINVCEFYNEEVQRKIDEEIQLNHQFEEAIKNKEFNICFQPKAAPFSRETCQAEALVRWLHPERGLIQPAQFIPLFEKNENICKLDLYVFEEVCRLISRWIQEKKNVSRISVNISRFHLKSVGGNVWKQYQEIKERYQIPDGIIEIELTETVFMDVNQTAMFREILNNFRACGFRVALDDFGVAYSSLSLLKEFEIDTLKLDRTFFMNENEKSRKIVKTIIDLAHSLQICVVAEGIEEKEQVAALQEMGCDLIQGYVYSKPLTAEEFETWMDNTLDIQENEC